MLARFEQVRFRVCRQHLGDNGGDNANVMGAIGKQQGVTVLVGKRHDGEDSTSPSNGAMVSAVDQHLAHADRSTYFTVPQDNVLQDNYP